MRGPQMKKFLAGMSFCAVAMFSTPVFAGPAVTTEWIEARMQLDTCKSRVVTAMRGAGVGSVEPKNYTVFGHKGDYTVAIRCMPDQGVIFFIVSGESLRNADSLLDDILAAYRR
jgi:hypothetical protein